MAAEADVGAPDDPEAESLTLAGETGRAVVVMIRLVEPGLLLIVVGVVLQVALLALGVHWGTAATQQEFFELRLHLAYRSDLAD